VALEATSVSQIFVINDETALVEAETSNFWMLLGKWAQLTRWKNQLL
jgi:hypothetical protein